jgi:hypothetical protein
MARNNLAEALGETFTPEETAAFDASQASEHEVQGEETPEPEPAPDRREAPAADAKTDDADPVIDPADVDPKTGKARKVNYGAFHAERVKRQSTETELAKAREEIAKFNGRFDTLRQMAQGQKPPAPNAPPQPEQIEVPDVNVDPVGHFEARSRIAEQRIEAMDKWRQQQEQTTTANTNARRISEIAQNSEAEFSKANPDYADAFAHLKGARDKTLESMGYKDPVQRQNIMAHEAIQLAATALQNGLSPAEVVYNMAKAQGYAKAAPPPPAAPTPTPIAKKIETVARGQAATQSLGQANGSAPTEISAEAVLKMSDAEFAKWAGDGDNFKKLMGG